MPKLKAVRGYIDQMNPGCELEIDGGVNYTTAELGKANGANVLVAGSAFFNAPDPLAFAHTIKG